MDKPAAVTIDDLLDRQTFGLFQLRVVLLCAFIQAFDGFDLSEIGMAAPSLSKAWGLPAAAFTPAFVVSSVGILFGALLSGPLGDRYGRRPLILVSLTFLGIFSVLSVFTWSISSITILRFLTGLGIGGAMPATVALTSDFCPATRRSTLIMLMFCGNTLGGFLGGQIVALMLPHFGWQVIFLLGGIAPLLLIPFLVVWLPESPHNLLSRRSLSRRSRMILDRLGIDETTTLARSVETKRANPVAGLFKDGLARPTILIWIAFFANLLNMYLFSYWLPTVLNLSGLSPATAIFASGAFMLGGILSTLLLGPLMDRYGASRVLACSFASGVLFIVAIGLGHLPMPFIMIPLFGAGAAIIGSQLGANALAAIVYPSRLRSTGVGWALGIGRLGGIAGPALGGALLAMDLPPQQIFMCACGPALIAACATIFLTFDPVRRQPVIAPIEFR